MVQSAISIRTMIIRAELETLRHHHSKYSITQANSWNTKCMKNLQSSEASCSCTGAGAPSWHGSAFFPAETQQFFGSEFWMSARVFSYIWGHLFVKFMLLGRSSEPGENPVEEMVGFRAEGGVCQIQLFHWYLEIQVLKKLQYSVICSHCCVKRSFCRSSQIYVGHHCRHCPKLKPMYSIRMNQTLLIKIIKKDTPRTWIRSHQRIDVESAKSLVVKSTWMNHLKLIIQRYWI